MNQAHNNHIKIAHYRSLGRSASLRAPYVSRSYSNMKKTLSKILLLMTLMSFVVLGIVFIQSMLPSERTLNEAEYVLKVNPLERGKLQIHNIRGRQLFVLKPDEEQMASIKYLDDHVGNKRTDAYNETLGAFIYWGHSTKFGSPLEHQQKNETAPPGWWDDRKWMGGYWHPWDEVSYDYAGRTITTHIHTYNGYNADYPNLKVPKMRLSGHKLIISLL